MLWVDPGTGKTYEWSGELHELTPVTVNGGEPHPLGTIDRMSYGLIDKMIDAGLLGDGG